MDATVSDSLVGRVLDGRYRVEARVARGGMATVYRALDVRLDRIVALKVMHQLFAEDDEFVARFIREAKSAARLSHPNVVAVFDQGDDDGHVFLAMEYVQGRTLRDLLRERGHLSPQEALSILHPVLAALSAAHAAGLVHRDVKPENVLLADDGRVKVADFGLARAVANRAATSATTLIGTVAYLAPEQVTRGVADARSDVYAAGIVLFEMLTGRPPYDGDTPISVAYRHAHEDVPPPSSVVPSTPASIDVLVGHATARDPDRRPHDAAAFMAEATRVRRGLPALESDAGSATTLTPRTHQTLVVELPEAGLERPRQPWMPAPPPQSPAVEDAEIIDEGYPRRRRRRRGWIALLLVLLLAAGAAGTGWWYGFGRWTKAPSLVSLTVSDATAKATAAGFTVNQGTAEYREDIPKGQVVRQNPPANHRLLHGRTITIFVSLGPQRFQVPAFDPAGGTPFTTYQQQLTAANLTAVQQQQYDEKVPKGNVIGVDPAPGTEKKRGDSVTVTTSQGPKPVPITDYTNKPFDAAKQALSAAGFTVTSTESFNDTVPTGTVISQTPNSGNGKKGDVITFDVSKGPQLIKVPDVRNKKTKDAQKTLTGLGFKVDIVAAPFGPGRVYDQSPSAGSMKPKGTTITLYVV
ncbi:MAG: eukaryotic-like serine/threonine-protein kinase [Actinomycetota bacterium]|nr:eukaryotic-like serine/threonine-protein kinase [Actinomycetota bacterium]